MDLNYEADIRIDEKALEQEVLMQAELAIKYGKNWAEQEKVVAKLEEKIKITRSGLVKKAHLNPDKHLGVDVKPTGPNVEAFYRTHKDHIAVKDELIEAHYELSLAVVAKNEFSYTRKAMLEALIKLHGQDYFAGPKVPRDISAERKLKDKERKDANASVKIGKKKKKNKKNK